MSDRRTFLKSLGRSALVLGLGGLPLKILSAADHSALVKLTILHTNDVHSRIEPFPMDGGKRQGLGGAAKRAALIRKIRSNSDHVLLLDAGDIFQGTPYFNFFGGELEFKLMSEMGYDAATIGNHDFDAGIDGLHKQLSHARFPMINCNYDFRDTLMEGNVLPYKIFEKGGLKIGVLGIGIELDGLVPQNLYGKTTYLDPIENANRVALHLKKEADCDYVICLSHLGYKYETDKISDQVFAKESRHIDLILGGHTHTFMDRPETAKNADGKPVLINQAGWAGIMLGQLDVYFERNKKTHCSFCENITIQ